MAGRTRFTRRDLIRLGAMSGAATLIGTGAGAKEDFDDQTPVSIDEVEFTGCSDGNELQTTSPFIVNPFTQELPIPAALRPGWRYPNGTLAAPTDTNVWKVRKSQFGATQVLPGPQPGHQDALGDRLGIHSQLNWGTPNAGTHQLWSSGPGVTGQDLGLPDPILFHIRLMVASHAFTSSPVVPITASGTATTLPTGVNTTAAGNVDWFGANVPGYYLPESTIYGFNGIFPGPMINVEYGRPVLVRFENDLDLNPRSLGRGDFGAPDWAFLTHLHNGHTAPESDGNPHHMMDNEGGYRPSEWSDNLYLSYPAGGDDREKQSFLWFHDHRMHHTGSNVYKGMVGLAPHYDPKIDSGDETRGLRLPGVRTNNLDADGNYDGTFDVKYDIPMALYDCRFNDGVTPHSDQHTPKKDDSRLPGLVCGDIHPEWWGKTFYKHYVNRGFVGDVFTVNGVAMPVLHVEKRKYRFRFLGASIARQYDLSLQTGTPMPFPGKQGQWNFGKLVYGVLQTAKGTVMLPFHQIASEGGLLPNVQKKNSIQIWPAKRREAIVDFSKDIDGRPIASGTVIYLVNTRQMLDGRMLTKSGDAGYDPNFCVPMVKIVIDGDGVEDNSLIPAASQVLRESPPYRVESTTKGREFNLEKGGLGGETTWLINGAQFDVNAPLAMPIIGSAETWGISNNGGGWTHPMHMHMEEHHVTYRSTKPMPEHDDDTGKEDVVALEPGEKTRIFRRFRTFLGNYVAHCHNLAHEDHNMMFGWTIRKP